ncbi:DUF2244 domain-containing protein [Prosthecomicrobium sp. N25]|uniref:DUF2244 domain-containing protein n=1 Tax=Prosthecomicrobium sp. N25 TaxID=3129254 RepID=UPI0030784DD5
MTDSNAEAAGRPFFSAVLTPHRSLGPRGFVVLMTCLSAVCFATGLLFWKIGAWPISGFLGLDVAVMWLAFRLSYRSARAFEVVEVSAQEILVRKVSPGGRRTEYRFNPVWVRLEVVHVEDEGVTRIALFSRGRAVDVGAFLNPDDRTSFAGALKAALATARSGGPVGNPA